MNYRKFGDNCKQLSYGFVEQSEVCPRNIPSFEKIQLFSIKIAENFRGYAFGLIIFREFGKNCKQLSYGIIELSKVLEFWKTWFFPNFSNLVISDDGMKFKWLCTERALVPSIIMQNYFLNAICNLWDIWKFSFQKWAKCREIHEKSTTFTMSLLNMYLWKLEHWNQCVELYKLFWINYSSSFW